MILIGYSGHSFVINGILKSKGIQVTGYCDSVEKRHNPLFLKFHGSETSFEGLAIIKSHDFFISVGNNYSRRQIYNTLSHLGLFPVNAIHSTSLIDENASISSSGVMIGGYVIINAFSKIGVGAICNSNCIIEHECIIGDFVHIAPAAVVCGNVHIGENSFIGARSVIREGIRIGRNVVVGAGSVVVKDIEDGQRQVGNPARQIHFNPGHKSNLC